MLNTVISYIQIGSDSEKGNVIVQKLKKQRSPKNRILAKLCAIQEILEMSETANECQAIPERELAIVNNFLLFCKNTMELSLSKQIQSEEDVNAYLKIISQRDKE